MKFWTKNLMIFFELLPFQVYILDIAKAISRKVLMSEA